jgi:hypothetical protein
MMDERIQVLDEIEIYVEVMKLKSTVIIIENGIEIY